MLLLQRRRVLRTMRRRSPAARLPGGFGIPPSAHRGEHLLRGGGQHERWAMGFIPTDAPTIRVASPGSRFLHLCTEGKQITFCGRVATYYTHRRPARDDCQRCVLEATSRGVEVPRR